MQDGAGNAVYSTEQLGYTKGSKPIVLSSPGTYNIVNKAYDTKEAKITVLDNQTSNGNLILGGFYTPTNQVTNTKDNDPILVHFNIIKRNLRRNILTFLVSIISLTLHVITVQGNFGLTTNQEIIL